MSRVAVYTAIFGPYDGLIAQPKLPGFDFICFTDQRFKSNHWKIITCEPILSDPTRESRRYKINPHLFLSDYDISIYIDGNFLIKGDLLHLIESSLSSLNMAVFDHNQTEDARNCIYEEFDALVKLSEEGHNKDSIELMNRQINSYKEANYPAQNGLISSGCLIRKHNEKEVIKTMEFWWNEIEKGSKRDQLSFNFSAWKTGLKFSVIDGNIRDNQWMVMLGKHRKSYKMKLFRYRFKKAFGLINQIFLSA